MNTSRLVLGPYETNCYIVRADNTSGDCLLIDTGLDFGELLEFIERNALNPTAAILTHGHADHIAAIDVLRRQYPRMSVYIHSLDAQMLTQTDLNLSALAGMPFTTRAADRLIEDGELIRQAGIELTVLHTPGHTPGGVCLYAKAEAVLFTGDTLFADSVGRTDFPNGSMEQLIKTIKEKILPLPDETVVYPGHGPKTTLGREKKHNQYLQ